MLQYLIYIHSCILPSWIVLQIAPMIFRQVLCFLEVQIAFGNCNGEGRRKDRSDVGKLCHFRWIVTLAIAHPRPKEPLLAIYSELASPSKTKNAVCPGQGRRFKFLSYVISNYRRNIFFLVFCPLNKS